MSENKLITVTSPLLPDLHEFEKLLEDIWQRKWLTNNGEVTVINLFSLIFN